MTTEIDHGPAHPAGSSALHQMIEAQFAWQRMFWHLPQIMWGNLWHVSKTVQPVGGHAPHTDHHDQLAVPAAVIDEGEHALFA